MSKAKVLENIYFDVRNPGSFGGVLNLFKIAKQTEPSITLNDVKNWVKNQLTYTLHKQIRNNFLRNKIIVQQINEQMEADLVDMQQFSRFNSGYKFIITVIDCFSKFLYAFPLKNKSSAEIIKVFKIIFKSEKPAKLRTDRGLEFVNTSFQKFLELNDVKFFTSQDSRIKCAIVERVNRTLKSKMFRYFTANGTRKYIDILQDLVSAYNHSYHRTIKMRPVDVSDANRKEVFENIYHVNTYQELYNKRQKSTLMTDDNVRLKYDLNKNMDKSYYPLWTDRVYKVDKILNKNQRVNYKVSSEGEQLKRSFYPEEVQKIGTDPVYRIEKVLRKRRFNGVDQILVKYIGYSNDYNQWINKTSLISPKDG